MRHVRSATAVVAVVCLLVAGCSSSTSTKAKANHPTTGMVPPEVAKHAADWPLPGRDYANSRARSDSTITTATIDRLAPAWSVPLPGAGAYGNASTTPVIVGDTVYVQDLGSNVRAIDLATGTVRWTHKYDTFQIGPNGAAVGYGNVYVANGPNEIAALDMKTGDEVWSTDITSTETDGVDIQPTVVAGLVLAATVPISLKGQYKGGDRGTLWALDAKTGEKVWSFDTVKGADLWGNPDLNSGGGSWYPPAIDVERGLVYWGVANPAPFGGTPEFPKGSSRPGPNLYTNSVVALHVRTGKLAWYHQGVPHDLFDHDLQLTAISAGANGVEAVIGTGKLGRVLVLDPDTGKLRSDTPIGIHQNDDAASFDAPVDVLPGFFGGVLTPPAVADGVAYAAVLNAPSKEEPNVNHALGGTKLGTMPGEVVAVDVATGKIRWSTPVDGDPLGGAIVLGDLVLTGTYQGTIVALDRASGKIVRSFAAPGGINGWPAATHDTLVWPIGNGATPSLVAYRISDLAPTSG
jgi:glucose dehydrogenase